MHQPVRIHDSDGNPITASNPLEVDVKTLAAPATLPLPTGSATEQGLDDILAKLPADPATQTTLAAVLAKIIAAPATEAKQDTIKAVMDTINGKITACNTGAVVLAAGEAHAGSIGGHVAIVTGTLTRPNDTPGAYSAKDEINTSTTTPTYITFSNVARVANGTGVIVVVTKKVNNAAATAQLRLHIYNAAPTPCNDHAAFAQLWADRAKYVGYVDFGAPVVEGTGSDMAMVQVSAINLPFTCAGGSRDLYGRVEVIVAGAAPAASQVWDFQLRALVD